MSKKEEHFKVRQAARFKCENCGEFTFAQYAHIEPDKNGGIYLAQNLLYLCYPCHRKLESTTSKGFREQALKRRMKMIKKLPKVDSVVIGIFDELLASERIVVRMGGVTFIDTPRLFQEQLPDHLMNSFLEIQVENGMLEIYGYLKDEHCNPLVNFSGTRFQLFTGDFWDIVRRQGFLKIINLTQNITLTMYQNDDLSLTLEGNLYLGHLPAQITFDEFIVQDQFSIKGSIIQNSKVGFLING